jgi:hypothetical protein
MRLMWSSINGSTNAVASWLKRLPQLGANRNWNQRALARTRRRAIACYGCHLHRPPRFAPAQTSDDKRTEANEENEAPAFCFFVPMVAFRLVRSRSPRTRLGPGIVLEGHSSVCFDSSMITLPLEKVGHALADAGRGAQRETRPSVTARELPSNLH